MVSIALTQKSHPQEISRVRSKPKEQSCSEELSFCLALSAQPMLTVNCNSGNQIQPLLSTEGKRCRDFCYTTRMCYAAPKNDNYEGCVTKREKCLWLNLRDGNRMRNSVKTVITTWFKFSVHKDVKWKGWNSHSHVVKHCAESFLFGVFLTNTVTVTYVQWTTKNNNKTKFPAMKTHTDQPNGGPLWKFC